MLRRRDRVENMDTPSKKNLRRFSGGVHVDGIKSLQSMAYSCQPKKLHQYIKKIGNEPHCASKTPYY